MEKETKETDKDFKYIVRIANTDLEGGKAMLSALRKIKGIGFSFANVICNAANIDVTKRIGNLTDKEISKIEEVIKSSSKFAPSWMLNHRKDYEDGLTKHLFTSDLDFANEAGIKRLKRIKSYRGVRHSLGLPVRGQKTRSNFRKNKGRGPGVKKAGSKKGRV